MSESTPTPMTNVKCDHEWFQSDACFWNCQKCGALRPYDPNKEPNTATAIARGWAEANAHHAHGPLGHLSRGYLGMVAERDALAEKLAEAEKEIKRLCYAGQQTLKAWQESQAKLAEVEKEIGDIIVAYESSASTELGQLIEDARSRQKEKYRG